MHTKQIHSSRTKQPEIQDSKDKTAEVGSFLILEVQHLRFFWNLLFFFFLKDPAIETQFVKVLLICMQLPYPTCLNELQGGTGVLLKPKPFKYI